MLYKMFYKKVCKNEHVLAEESIALLLKQVVGRRFASL